jgi:hypothetical protein
MTTGLTACSTTPNPVAAGTDTVSYGNLTVGEKFGARIGQSAAEAEGILLAKGYGYEGAVACPTSTQAYLGCSPSEQYLAFQPVQNDQQGHIYLRIDNGRVAQIGWQIHHIAALDG